MATPRLSGARAFEGILLALLIALAPGAVPTVLAQTTILPLGDSITRGREAFPFPAGVYPESDYRRRSGGPPNDLRSYREHLHDLLVQPSCGADIEWLGAQRFAGRVPEVHQGISGWRFDDYLRETRDWPNQTGLYPGGDDWKLRRWLDEFDAEVVLLKLGTNDILRGQSPSSTADELRDMLDRIFAANANSTVFVANLIPIVGWSGDNRAVSPYDTVDVAGNVDIYNSLALDIVSQERANGRDVHLVDVNDGFYVDENNPVSCPAETGGDPNNMSLKLCFTQPGGSNSIPDGIHPGLLGARFIAERFYDALDRELNVCGGGGGGGGPDTQAPVANIGTPSSNGQTFDANPVFAGNATDAGGSGFDRVRVVVRDNDADPATWLNFSTGRFERQNGRLPDRNATLSNTTTSSTSWRVNIPLSTPGDYQLFVLGYDNAGNDAFTQGDGWTERRFLIGGSVDTQAPTVSIGAPAAREVVASNVTFSGSANDGSGSGVERVEVAVKRTSDNHWFDFSARRFSSGLKSEAATLSGSNWTLGTRLPPGNYRLYVHAIDRAGNYATTSSGRPNWLRRYFEVSSSDTVFPTVSVGSPSSRQILPSEATFSGSAADGGGSGFGRVEVAIKRTSDNFWFDSSSETFSRGLKHDDATLSSTSASSTSWSLSASLPPGNYRLYVRAFDGAGNVSGAWVRTYFSVGSSS